MTWFRVDDSFGDHAKVRSIPRKDRMAAIGLWTVAGVWCARHLKDGALPRFMLEELAATKRSADALVAAGLWTETELGYQFNDWDKWQPTREAVESKRQSEADRKARWRQSRQDSGPRPPVVPVGQGADGTRDTGGTDAVVLSPRPDPTRPDPTVVPNGTTSRVAEPRGSRLPDDFPITDDMHAWARENAPNVFVAREHIKFRDYWAGVAGAKGRKADWLATWRNWMRRASDDAGPRESFGQIDVNPWITR